MGRRITVTADHPFVVGDGIDGDRTTTKLAGDLNERDWLPLAQGFPLVPSPAQMGMDVGAPGTRVSNAAAHIECPITEDRGRGLTDASQPRLGVSGHRSGGCGLTDAQHGGIRGRQPLFALQNRGARVPDVVWAASPADKRALLRGLWDGDGSWSLIRGGPSVAFEYGTVSRELADGMTRLLGDLGIVARVKVGRTRRSTCDTYWLTISGAEQLERCLWLFPEEEQAEILRSIRLEKKRIAPTGHRRLSKNAAWLRVTSTTRRPFDGPVYSLSVPDAHTVVTSFGLVLHQCFPKDTRALVHIADNAGYDFNLLRGVITVNEEQFERVADKVTAAAGGSIDGKTVAVWGLTFKARTDDLRESPAIEVIKRLVGRGATIRAYDPAVSETVDGIAVVDDAYAACDGADVLVVLTEWDDFKWLDFDKVAGSMTTKAIVDARNLLDRAMLERRGFQYVGIGLT
jgi:UDPglucose 6-dehydrogenase